MSKKEKFTNCFGEEMERQVEEVEEKIGVEIDKDKLVAALNKMINDPESVAAIEKKVGKYEWRTGADGDAAVRTLKSFITPEALKTLADFKREQLGYNTVYKEELTQ